MQSQEGVLNDVLRGLLVADQEHGDPDHRQAVGAEQASDDVARRIRPASWRFPVPVTGPALLTKMSLLTDESSRSLGLPRRRRLPGDARSGPSYSG
jgi:hypothetical protein